MAQPDLRTRFPIIFPSSNLPGLFTKNRGAQTGMLSVGLSSAGRNKAGASQYDPGNQQPGQCSLYGVPGEHGLAASDPIYAAYDWHI